MGNDQGSASDEGEAVIPGHALLRPGGGSTGRCFVATCFDTRAQLRIPLGWLNRVCRRGGHALEAHGSRCLLALWHGYRRYGSRRLHGSEWLECESDFPSADTGKLDRHVVDSSHMPGRISFEWFAKPGEKALVRAGKPQHGKCVFFPDHCSGQLIVEFGGLNRLVAQGIWSEWVGKSIRIERRKPKQSRCVDFAPRG